MASLSTIYQNAGPGVGARSGNVVQSYVDPRAAALRANMPTDPNQAVAYAMANRIDPTQLGLNAGQINYGEQGNMGAVWNLATGQMESTTGQPYMANAGNGGGAYPAGPTAGYDMTGASQPQGGVPGWQAYNAANPASGSTPLGAPGFGTLPPGDPNAPTAGIPTGEQPNGPGYSGLGGPAPAPLGGGMATAGMGLGTLDPSGTSLATPGAGSSSPYDVANFLDPSMGFQMDQGMRALGSSAAAGGQTFSGNTLKDILNYSQGLASTDYGNAFNRAQQQQQFGYGVQKDNQTIPFQQEMQLAGLGMQGNAINADLSKSLAGLISGNTIAGGQAAGAGTIGGNNAITQMLTSIFGNLQGNSTLQQILARAGGTPAPATTA
jgi:hypothetical protein